MKNVELDDLELATAWVEAILTLPDLNSCSEVLRKAKLEAVKASINLTQCYRKEGIRDDLVHTVLCKRLEMIHATDKFSELREIAAPPIPHYTGNGFVAGPFDVPEEEMIIWSLTSLKAPLMRDAFERYMDLFAQCFGVDMRKADDLKRLEHMTLEVT